ncbi:MAG: 16S rRNA (guanine(966)-N(2))-methyltransferase RsmD [Clostridia bacterium]|nr:16S rRNA (guanine(966)-N(2))-methyltransferase RsmD [Clostridia bacterium]
MRVITGTARGMSLKTLEGETTRPTTEKVKEAVFSAIQFEIEGRRVLDLFAGSGQMGIEALSRGAESAVFVDADKNAIKIVKENVEKTRLNEKAQIMQMDALGFLNMNIRKFDLVFLDPPYSTGLLEKALKNVADFVAEGGVVICEHPFSDELPEENEGLIRYRSYKYGKTAVTIYRKD